MASEFVLLPTYHMQTCTHTDTHMWAYIHRTHTHSQNWLIIISLSAACAHSTILCFWVYLVFSLKCTHFTSICILGMDYLWTIRFKLIFNVWLNEWIEKSDEYVESKLSPLSRCCNYRCVGPKETGSGNIAQVAVECLPRVQEALGVVSTSA